MMRFMLAALIACVSAGAEAIPPPPTQVSANCADPTYASDFLVCETPELRELDETLAAQISERVADPARDDMALSDVDWFRHSRRCAFETDQLTCLTVAYCLRIALLASAGGPLPQPCAAEPGDWRSASSISRNGFARDPESVRILDGQKVGLWGYVDHANLYGDAAARAILGDWWGGESSDAGHWRFNLKAAADDPAGASFAVIVPNDLLRDDWLRLFAADAKAGRPTQVFIRGTLSRFDAPTGAARLTGLRMDLPSSARMRLARPASSVDLRPESTYRFLPP